MYEDDLEDLCCLSYKNEVDDSHISHQGGGPFSYFVTVLLLYNTGKQQKADFRSEIIYLFIWNAIRGMQMRIENKMEHDLMDSASKDFWLYGKII